MWELAGAGATVKPPARVEGLDAIVAVVTGLETNLALRADGTAWVWLPYGAPRPVPAPIAGTPTP
jgi:hypothetical protein